MASRPSMVLMPILLIVASSMAMLVSSKIAEPEMTKISSINLPQLSPNQFSDEKMFDIPGLQQCWASFSKIGGCIDDINLILRAMKSERGGKAIPGLIGPACCDVVKVMHEHCWPQMIPDPFFIKINFFCAHHHHHHHHHSIPKIPTPVGPPPPMAPQVPAPAPAPQDPSQAPAPQDPSPTPAPQDPSPAPAPQDPSLAPAPQDPPQSPAPPQYSFPTPPGPQDPLPSPATPQHPLPTPSAPQDPLPSPTTPQYPLPTPPAPPRT